MGVLQKTLNGDCLNDKEINQLASQLDLTLSSPKLIWKLIISFLLIISSVLSFVIYNKIVGIIVSVSSFVIILFILLIKNNKAKIINYLDTLRDASIEKYSKYEGFESVLVVHDYQKSGFLQNNLAVLMTDGYEFFIFDDKLKNTFHELPRCFRTHDNKHPVLKVFDKDYVDKKPVSFILSDIDYFKVNGEYLDFCEEQSLGKDYERYTMFPKQEKLDRFCYLELTDRSVFKMSLNAAYLLRKYAKGKERQ